MKGGDESVGAFSNFSFFFFVTMKIYSILVEIRRRFFFLFVEYLFRRRENGCCYY